MTIAISLKVNDGIVLASDSASTMFGQDERGATGVAYVFNNANKVFNLRKGLPVGAIVWGSASIGSVSIGTLLKDLRERLTDPADGEWRLDPSSYSVGEVAAKVRRFVYEQAYVPFFRDWSEKPNMGIIVAGYSSSGAAEEFEISITDGECREPTAVRALDQVGVAWRGEPEAISRLILGHGTALPTLLQEKLGVPEEQIAPAMAIIQTSLSAPLVVAPMPIQDAIDVAEFLVQLTIQFSRFAPGAPTVGGPIELAAITKHEGFKWVARKYYYPESLNPREA